MGLYFNWPDKYNDPRDKRLLAEELGGKKCTESEAFDLVDSPDKAVMCWVDNGPWDALAYAYNKRELEAFIVHDRSGRDKQLYIVDRAVAEANAKG